MTAQRTLAEPAAIPPNGGRQKLTLATFSAHAYRARRDRARAQVAAGAVDAARANAALAPWLAIACLAGADLPELARMLNAGDGATRSRSAVADWICPRARWLPVLAAARDTALDRLAAEDQQACEAPGSRHGRAADISGAGGDSAEGGRHKLPDATNAAGLVALAQAFAFDPNGHHHLPPYIPASAKAQAVTPIPDRRHGREADISPVGGPPPQADATNERTAA